MNAWGPVSAVLEEELRREVQRGTVVWLDGSGHYTGFAEALVRARAAGSLPYAVHTFRGSHLALMLELEHAAGGADPSPLVVHLPGFDEAAVRQTPLLELYEAGRRFRKALDTLVLDAATGRVAPDAIAAFRAGGELTLEAADAWLAARLSADAGGGFSAQLQAVSLSALVDDLLTGGFVAGRVRDPLAQDALWQTLHTRTGLREAWRDHALPPTAARPKDLAFAVASWAMAVEYVHDLHRLPADPKLAGLDALAGGLVEACQGLARHLRDHHPTFYRQTADEAETWLGAEVAAAKAADLGKVDTFRFEEDKILDGALEALVLEDWPAALAWAATRTDGRTTWLRDDPSRCAAWSLIAAAATLGAALTTAGPGLKATSLEHAAERYDAVGADVDRAHRHLEQRRTALLYPQLPEYERLRERLNALRDNWRDWANNWSREFNKLCKDQGFLPPANLQQRTLFDEVVRPMTQEPGITALFLVDALRYEMAVELRELVGSVPATTAHLRPRLAELPTVTEVGMNALAPVARGGRLTPAVIEGAFNGFSVGAYRVTGPDTRHRAMWERVGGGTCPWLNLAEVLSHDTTSLKAAVARARLVVVHSIEIDAAGEKGVGPSVFDVVLQQLAAAWQLLREAGVRRFVVTADHGFLLLDDEGAPAQSHGRTVDPKRRHVVSTAAADIINEVRVALSDLAYDDTDGLHLLFPESTAVFDTGKRLTSFVHGGNSLQERVIPVLTVVHRAAAGGDTRRFAVVAEARDGVANLHCLSGRVELVSQGELSFGGASEVALVLGVVEAVAATVELCQVRGGARLEGGALHATVGTDFELFFRLTAPQDARVRVELRHPTGLADVNSCVLDTRFLAVGTAPPPASPAPSAAGAGAGWLDDFEGGVRQLFEHLAAHGAVTEDEAMNMLGGGRALRRFSTQFEALAAKAPFAVRIDTIGGVKRYVREGSIP